MTGTGNFEGGAKSLLQPIPPTELEERRASRVVAARAVDVQDCVLLLDMLGLYPKA